MAKKQDGWQSLLEIVATDDGLPTFDAGSWTGDKLYWWNRYVEITTTAMVENPNWPGGVVYVDLFAGPGVCRNKRTRDRYPGSPIIAVNAPKSFRTILLCERDGKAAAACRDRLQRIAPTAPWFVFEGDCNQTIDQVVHQIPANSLTLAFIDPTGLHASFQAIKRLTTGRAVDLLVLFADFMDIVRNVEQYAAQATSNLDRVLGPSSNWRHRWRSLADHSSANVSKLFLEIYQDQLRQHLGYSVFGSEVLYKQRGSPLYRLLYASRHARGLDFWQKSTSKARAEGRLQYD